MDNIKDGNSTPCPVCFGEGKLTMTPQEKIREGLARGLAHCDVKEWGELTRAIQLFYLSEADRIRNYLHKRGVVVKVERELPEDNLPIVAGLETHTITMKSFAKKIRNDMLKAGYKATVPLIEEVKDADK